MANSVATWYNENANAEDQRLDVARVEYAITLHVLRDLVAEVQQRTSRERLRIADIGCGTGQYAVALAQGGHELSIADMSSAEIALAEQKAIAAGVRYHITAVLDACQFQQHKEIYKEGYYDMTLLFGPLCHILDLEKRKQVLLSSLKTIRSGGFVVAAFVTRNAHLRDLANKDPLRLSRESEFYSQYLKDGNYTRGTNAPMHHTMVTEVRSLLSQVLETTKLEGFSFELMKMVSCEGFLGSHNAQNLTNLNDEEFSNWLNILLDSASDEEILGAADHLLVVLRRA